MWPPFWNIFRTFCQSDFERMFQMCVKIDYRQCADQHISLSPKRKWNNVIKFSHGLGHCGMS